MKLNFFHAALLSAITYGLAIGHVSAETTFSYQFVDTYDEVCGEDNDDDGCAEISAYDHDLGRLFTTNGSGNAIRVLELFESNKLQDAGSISLAAYGAAPNSVAAHGGVLAVAVEADDKQAPGSVVFFDSLTLEFRSSVAVGALPDMIAFTPDGRYLVVANEGEPSDDYSVDPEGSISIINVATSDVSHAFFTAFNNAIDPEVRIFGPNASVAQDLEPEYIAISADSSTAYVSLQENNALAVVDIEQATVLDVVALGYKNHALPGNGFDASDRDGGDNCAFALEDPENCINIMTQPTLGMYQPDAIASYSVDGTTYLVSANEGDARDYDEFSEEFRVGDDDFVLDSQAYPTADALKDDAALGRLKTTNATGDTDQDGDIDQVYSYGARSFSIWNTSGDLVFDSGDEFEQTLKMLQAAGEDVWVDSRSDDKGPEPESIMVAEISKRHIAFIGLERVSGVMVYDITSPTSPLYVGYINTKKAGDISPEGLLYVTRTDDSGALVVTNEVSNTTSVYRVSLSAGAGNPSDSPSDFTVNNDSIVINSDDYYQVQTTDTYQTICEGEMLGTCVTGPGVFNVINLTTGMRDENVEVFADGSGAMGPQVTGNVISWVGKGYFQVQSTDDFQTICEGTDFNSCEVPPGSYHLINHTTGQRDEFIEVGDDGSAGGGSPGVDPAFTLKILHVNDHHSHLDEDGVGLLLAGQDTDVSLGGFPRVVSKIKQLEADQPNVLKLHAGDAITGTLLYTLFNGEADAALMNEVCFDAFVLGNHEFDAGDSGLVTFLDYLNSGSCSTDVLSANVVPELGVSPLALSTATDYIMPYTIKLVGDERVGIVGITIANKTKNSSNPDDSTTFLDEFETAQATIDTLRNVHGIDKIVLLTHYQYTNDLALASALDGVDIIVGGDSHTLLGDGLAQFGLTPQGPYPSQTFNAGGNKVCVVQAWQYAQVVGELDVTFDNDGNVVSCSGVPHLLLGSTFERENDAGDDVELAGDDLQAVLAAIESSAELSIVEPDSVSQNLLDTFVAQADVLGQQTIGSASEDLCLERIPGQGRSQICPVTQTASKGSDISNIVALAFKTQSNTSDIAIQNAGGVRVDVAAGDISVETAYTLLPFANTLVEIDMSGLQIIQTLEDALDFALSEDGSTGAYPYASGLRWRADASQPKGSRFSSVEVKLKGDADWSPIDQGRTYKVVTNSFIAGGRDGYLTLGDISDDNKVDTFLDYAQSFVDYVLDVGTLNRLADDDYSTQSYINADGMLQ